MWVGEDKNCIKSYVARLYVGTLRPGDTFYGSGIGWALYIGIVSLDILELPLVIPTP